MVGDRRVTNQLLIESQDIQNPFLEAGDSGAFIVSSVNKHNYFSGLLMARSENPQTGLVYGMANKVDFAVPDLHVNIPPREDT